MARFRGLLLDARIGRSHVPDILREGRFSRSRSTDDEDHDLPASYLAHTPKPMRQDLPLTRPHRIRLRIAILRSVHWVFVFLPACGYVACERR